MDTVVAWQRKVFISLKKFDIPALSLDDLISPKRDAGRKDALEDVKILKKAKIRL